MSLLFLVLGALTVAVSGDWFTDKLCDAEYQAYQQCTGTQLPASCATQEAALLTCIRPLQCEICEDAVQTYHDYYPCAGGFLDWGSGLDPHIKACQQPQFDCSKLQGSLATECETVMTKLLEPDAWKSLYRSLTRDAEPYLACSSVRSITCPVDPNFAQGQLAPCHTALKSPECENDFRCTAPTQMGTDGRPACSSECYLCYWIAKSFPLFQESCKEPSLAALVGPGVSADTTPAGANTPGTPATNTPASNPSANTNARRFLIEEQEQLRNGPTTADDSPASSSPAVVDEALSAPAPAPEAPPRPHHRPPLSPAFGRPQPASPPHAHAPHFDMYNSVLLQQQQQQQARAAEMAPGMLQPMVDPTPPHPHRLDQHYPPSRHIPHPPPRRMPHELPRGMPDAPDAPHFQLSHARHTPPPAHVRHSPAQAAHPLPIRNQPHQPHPQAGRHLLQEQEQHINEDALLEQSSEDHGGAMTQSDMLSAVLADGAAQAHDLAHRRASHHHQQAYHSLYPGDSENPAYLKHADRSAYDASVANPASFIDLKGKAGPAAATTPARDFRADDSIPRHHNVAGLTMPDACLKFYDYVRQSRKARYFASFLRYVNVLPDVKDRLLGYMWDANVVCKCLGHCDIKPFENLALLDVCKYDQRAEDAMTYQLEINDHSV